ncbi:MAG: NF038129 family PEP-CTERM protein [Gammaproteobacteria bacterium]
MTRNRLIHAATLAVGLWLGLGTAVTHATAIFNVTLDTTSISGETHSVAFDLIDGDGVTNNTVSVSNFMFNGGGITGAPNLTGGASGDMNSTVSLVDTVFFNSFDQKFTAGNFLSFSIDISSNFDGGFPDNFAFYLLDDSGDTIATTDPFGTNSFFTIDLQDPLIIQTFSSIDANQLIPEPVVAQVVEVPDPSLFSLLVLGLAGMVASRRMMRSGD